MMHFTVDRLEEGFAVLESEGREMITVAKELLPKDVAEGDVLLKTDTGFVHDEDAQKARSARIREKMKGLWT